MQHRTRIQIHSTDFRCAQKAGRWWALIISLIVCMTGTSAFATTYYVAFSGGSDSNSGTSRTTPWKHVKGMTGCMNTCNSTTIVGGDTIIFKGGETWIASYPWTLQGGASSMITYTVDQSWFSGASWSPPTFDGQGAHPGVTGMTNMINSGYVTLNKLKFVNAGVDLTIAGAANSDKALVFTNCHDITITNSTFATESWLTLYFPFLNEGSYSNFLIDGNDFSHTGGPMWMATNTPNINVHMLSITNNVYHDLTSQIGYGVHGNGALHWFTVPHSDSTQHIDGVLIANNRFYGDFRRSVGTTGGMSAFVLDEGGLSGAIINNEMSFYPVEANMFNSFILVGGNGNASSGPLQIYNNTFFNNGVNAMSAAINMSSIIPNVTVKNNLFVGMKTPIYVADPATPGFVSDYNMFHTWSFFSYGKCCDTWAEWQAHGFDAHSVNGGTVGFVSTTDPFDLHIASMSSAILKGADLSNLGITVLKSDRNGIPRGLFYSIGAYQGGTGVTISPSPGPPANLIVK